MSEARLVLSVVDSRTGESHRVHVDVAALHRRVGRYPALCGAEVVSASLATAPSRHCADCARRAGAERAGQQPATARQRRRPRRRTNTWHVRRAGAR